MSLSQFRELASLGAGLPRYLRDPVSVEAAHAAVAWRAAHRAEMFLAAAASLIYAHPGSPVLRLLQWAGCERGDLRKAVDADGVEETLRVLRKNGVYFSSEELRGSAPVQRGSFVFDTAASDFDSPLHRAGLRGSTSGTTGSAVPVRYSWPFLAEEAENELLLLESHGLAHATLALWMPGPPGIAGLHNLLLHARTGRPPARWFSQTKSDDLTPMSMRAIGAGIRIASRAFTRFGPSPEWVPFERAEEIARWLSGAGSPAVLKAFASSVTRVATAALEKNIDLTGRTAFAGGEALSSRARTTIERSGLTVHPRYVATESGLIAGGCPDSLATGEMHLYADRLALVPASDENASALAITSLSMHAPRVLLNAELGDHGRVHSRNCDCALGRAGLNLFVSEVSSPDKTAAAGVKLWTRDFADLVALAVTGLGGAEDEFQIWLEDDASGASRIRIVIPPESSISEQRLLDRINELLPRLKAGALAAMQWSENGAMTVDKRPLRLSAGQKMTRVLRGGERNDH